MTVPHKQRRCPQILHAVVRLLLYYKSARIKHYVGLAVISCIYFVCYRALSQLAGTAS